MRDNRKTKVRPGCLRRLLGLVLVLGTVALLVGAGAGWVVYQRFATNLPDVGKLAQYQPSETTRILSSDGQVIATLYEENRVWAPLDKVSPHVVKALLAIEDSRFYEHHGVDPVGVLRAVYVALQEGAPREGASTITMQLARNLFLNNEPTARRKVQESILAYRIEQRYSKEKILELYLNQVYFGAGAYGIHSAAGLYLGRGPGELTPAQSALLVGLLQAPSVYSPLVNEAAARERQKVVLKRMHGLGYLDQPAFEAAVQEAETATYAPAQQEQSGLLKYPYFTSYVIQELSQRYPEDVLYRAGLTIHTTVDLRLQTLAEGVLRARVYELQPVLNVDSGALVLVENETGYIRAMVGGLGWSDQNQFNRAWQAHRQPGSSFKAVVYAAGMEAGFTPDSIVEDSPVTFGNWSPKNSDGRYMGRITLRTALATSRNVAAVRLASSVGIDSVIALAYKMGIRSRMEDNLSIALGSIEATPLEMAQVFQIFANRGLDRQPTAIKQVVDANGNVLEDSRTRAASRVLSEETAARMTGMLAAVVTSGTGNNAQVEGFPVAGKTGTTDSFRDAWFVGFSPYYTLSVWVGNDDNAPMWRSYGGDLPAGVFREVMSAALEGKPRKEFPPEPGAPRKRMDLAPAGPETPRETPTPEESPAPTPEEEAAPEPRSPEDPEPMMTPVLPVEPEAPEAPPASQEEEPEATPAGWFE